VPLAIEEWLSSSDEEVLSHPLIIIEDEQAPTKTILASWREMHGSAKNQQRDIIIEHYFSLGWPNQDPAYALFSIMARLKSALSLRSVIQVEPERIRTSFRNWLQACHEAIDQQDLVPSLSGIQSILLVMEGLDRITFRDIADPMMWLPKSYPSRVRMIFTVQEPAY
jgi:hypothetical protein